MRAARASITNRSGQLGGSGTHAGVTPVVLVHGMVISGRYMVPTAEELAPLYPVYAVDLPGYGDSVKPRAIVDLPELADSLAAWMDAMKFPTAHLVANSFGCQVLAEFALRHARRVDRLVFQGPTVDPRPERYDITASDTRRCGHSWLLLLEYFALASCDKALPTGRMVLLRVAARTHHSGS